MLEANCTAEAVRAIEGGVSPAGLWQAIEESGFADALLPESAEGAGLGMRDVLPLLLASGAHALPVPFATTMVLRALLAEAGLRRTQGSITLAAVAQDDHGAIRCAAVPFGAVADWAVVGLADRTLLLDVRTAERVATGVHGSLEADLAWQHIGTDVASFASRSDWLAIGAALLAVQMAGAMQVVLDRTIAYANERAQFGRTIGKFQAIQQQIAVMAEDVYASHMAAEMACAGDGIVPAPTLAAVAKARVSEAAWNVASIAHAVHGAIGITREYDLQLHTRRLHEWRLAYGAESYWNGHVGAALVASGSNALDFIRSSIFVWDRPAA